MFSYLNCLFSLLAATIAFVSGLIIPESVAKRSVYPFNQIVSFGDELSDNGNGSYAHGISGDPGNVYGFGTWTDGPVAVSYLADLLGVPLTDYAFGAGPGGGAFGATINNTYTAAEATYKGKSVPSVHDQIFLNYTAKGAPSNIQSALQFIWTGENDLSEHTDAFWEGDPRNAAFAAEISKRIAYNAEHLVELGAPYVFVANIYPKHKAPVTTKYLCSDGSCVDTWGKVIQSANSAIEQALKNSKYANKLIYYDVFSFMMDIMDDKDSYGLTQPLTDYCDGDTSSTDDKWDQCIAGAYTWQGATDFYWMSFIQPTTTVHRLIAQDMKKTLDSFLAV